MTTAVIESDYVITYLRYWLFLVLVTFWQINSLQSADKGQQEMRDVAEKPHDAVVKFDT